MNKWTKIAVALSGITLTGATAFYLYGNYKALDELDFTIDSVSVSGSSDTLRVLTTINLKNPTDFNVKIFGYSFDVTLDGTYLGTAVSDKEFVVSKNGFTKMEIPFEIYKSSFDIQHVSDLVKLITKVVKKETLSAKINGKISAGFNKLIKTSIDFKDYEVYTI